VVVVEHLGSYHLGEGDYMHIVGVEWIVGLIEHSHVLDLIVLLVDLVEFRLSSDGSGVINDDLCSINEDICYIKVLILGVLGVHHEVPLGVHEGSNH
jgi:hypothetical protein